MATPARPPLYVLATPARNEQDFIERTLRSVVGQTVRPARWIIVSDGSTDRTDEIVAAYAARHDFIRLLRRPPDAPRGAAAKVAALEPAFTELAALDYDFIGNLDADVSFAPDYFAIVLRHFAADPALGLCGGRIHQADDGGAPRETPASPESVAGAVQLFRRACFEQIGGYRPLPGGMEDGVAEISARFHGWRTRSIPGLAVLHHRPVGTVGRSVQRARLNSGRVEYRVGYGFLYVLLRALSRLAEKPRGLGTLLILIGYGSEALARRPRALPPELVAFIRREQRTRVRQRLIRLLARRHTPRATAASPCAS